MWTSPSFPERMYSTAAAAYSPLRVWAPTCTIRLYLRAASTILWPSHGLCEAGFST